MWGTLGKIGLGLLGLSGGGQQQQAPVIVNQPKPTSLLEQVLLSRMAEEDSDTPKVLPPESTLMPNTFMDPAVGSLHDKPFSITGQPFLPAGQEMKTPRRMNILGE